MVSPKNLQQQTRQIEISEVGEKIYQDKQINTTEKSHQYSIDTVKPSSTIKQNKQTIVANKTNKMMYFTTAQMLTK